MITSSSLVWIQPDTPLLPNGGKYGMISATYNSSIYLLGGMTATQQTGFRDIIEYNIITDNYTVFSDITDNMRTESQLYTQIQSKVYIYCSSTDYIVTYDMALNIYNNEYTLKQNTNLEDPCITNIHSEFLLLLGGSISPNYQNGFHIFNLLTKQWMTNGPNMLSERAGFTCAVHNNYLYAIGGSNAVSILDTVSIIYISNMTDIMHQNWSTLDDRLNVSRNGLQSVIYRNDLYVLGGYSGNALFTFYDQVDIIDTITNTIYLDSTLITAALKVSAVIALDTLFVFGGYNDKEKEMDKMQYALLQKPIIPSSSVIPTISFAPTSQTYSPSSVTALFWMERVSPQLPKGGRYGIISGFYGESIYLLGGRTAGTPNGFQDLIEYNINTNNYTIHNDIQDNIQTFSQSYTQINSKIYMYSSSTNYIVTYDMVSNIYDAAYATKQNVDLITPCLTNLGTDLLFILGGSISPDYNDGFHIFNLSAMEWMENGPHMLASRSGHSCKVHKDYLYVIGGGNSDGMFDTVIIINISDMTNINMQNWSVLEDRLNKSRNQLFAATFEDDIYIIGGWSGNQLSIVYSQVDVIHTITNTIHLDSKLITEALGISSIVALDRIYAFGGYNLIDNELATFEYAILSPTPQPTRAPSFDTISPTSNPSTAPSIPPTIAPSHSPSIPPSNTPTVSPSSNPTLSPTYSPSMSPSLAPTRWPTKHNEYSQSIYIQYTFNNLTQLNINAIINNETVLNSIVLILERLYVDISQLYANEEEEYLEYREFHIIAPNLHEISYSFDARRVTWSSTVQFESSDVGNTIAFISTKQIFVLRTSALLAQSLNNENITLTAMTITLDLDSESKSFDYILYGLITLMVIMSIISILAFMNNQRSSSFIDDCKWIVLFVVGLQIVDFVSDINLCLEMVFQFKSVFDYDDVLLYIAGYGSILFVIMPYSLNICMALKIKRYVSGNNAASVYVEQRSAFVTTLVVLTGSIYTVLDLTASRLFGLDAFNSGLTNFELRNLSKMKLYGSVLCENVPQLFCQLIYITYLGGKPSPNTTLSFIASLLSIISVVLTYAVNNKSIDCFVVEYYLKMSTITGVLTKYEKQQISRNKERKEKWKKEFCQTIKTPKSCIEFGYVTLINDGFMVHVIHYVFKHQFDINTNTNSSYQQIAKQFIQTLYKQNQKQVNASFNKHFSFTPNTMSVQYFEKAGYNQWVHSVDVQLTDYIKSNERENSLLEKVQIVAEIKRSLDQNNDAKQLKQTLLKNGYRHDIIDQCFSFLKIEQTTNDEIKQDEDNEVTWSTDGDVP